jgi:hypothetical protein
MYARQPPGERRTGLSGADDDGVEGRSHHVNFTMFTHGGHRKRTP